MYQGLGTWRPLTLIPWSGELDAIVRDLRLDETLPDARGVRWRGFAAYELVWGYWRSNQKVGCILVGSDVAHVSILSSSLCFPQTLITSSLVFPFLKITCHPLPLLPFSSLSTSLFLFLGASVCLQEGEA